MKYLFTIIAIVGVITALSLSLLLSDNTTPQGDIALTINGHDIGENDITSEGRKFSYHTGKDSEMYDTYITRELLLQEAQKQAIHKEGSFRKALQTYYENSLIKILLERKNNELEVHVSEEDIDGYITFVGRVVSFTRLDTMPNSAADVASAKGLSTRVPFDDLAAPVKLLLSSLKTGQYGIKFDTGSEKYAVRLDSIGPSPSASEKTIDRHRIREMLEDYKRETQMNVWLTELKQNATITIHNKE